MSNDAALAFERVTVRYEPDPAPVLSDVSFSLAAGERAALLGLNGSGKTTLLTTAVGLNGHEGEIRVLGTTLSRKTEAGIRERTGFLFNVPEDQLLFPTVMEDAAFGLLRRGGDAGTARRRTREVLEVMELGGLAERPLDRLSHGQKLRVALAGALVTDPALLLLDEPSAGLDPPGRAGLARLLDGLGAAMLVASHDVEFAARFCRRFIFLERGRIVYDGDNAGEAERCWRTEGLVL